MKQIRENAGGIDIGSRHIYVGLASKEVKVFETFTEDLEYCAYLS